MQLTLTQSGDYAIRAVLVVARRGVDRRIKAREIAVEMDIPEGYAPQILSTLVRVGILDAAAGPSGGYALAVPAAQISLLSVIRAVEGPIERERCVLAGGPCDWRAVCPLHPTWHDLEEAVTKQLAATTFDQLAAMDHAIETGAAPIPRDTHGPTAPRRGLRQAGPPIDDETGH